MQANGIEARAGNSFTIEIPPTDLNKLDTHPEPIKNPITDQFEKIRNESQVRPNEAQVEPPTVLKKTNGDHFSILATLGNISLIIGKAKSKKTFLVSLFISVMIAKNEIIEGILGSLPLAKNRVILFDTEQSKYHVYKVVSRICRLAKQDNPTHFSAYCLRPYDPFTRLKYIEYIIKNTPDVGFIVIDGIRDLITDINSPEQATMIATWLLRITEVYNVHILTVLHQNKGDNNARGHVGAELTNKAETVLSVIKDTQNRDISIVEPEYCRDREFDPFAFTVNEHGLPVIVDHSKEPEESNRRKRTPYDYDIQFHFNFLRELFKGEKQYRHKDLLDQTKVKLQGIIGAIGDSKTRDFITYYQQMNWIKKEGQDRSPKAFYVLGELS